MCLKSLLETVDELPAGKEHALSPPASPPAAVRLARSRAHAFKASSEPGMVSLPSARAPHPRRQPHTQGPLVTGKQACTGHQGIPAPFKNSALYGSGAAALSLCTKKAAHSPSVTTHIYNYSLLPTTVSKAVVSKTSEKSPLVRQALHSSHKHHRTYSSCCHSRSGSLVLILQEEKQRLSHSLRVTKLARGKTRVEPQSAELKAQVLKCDVKLTRGFGPHSNCEGSRDYPYFTNENTETPEGQTALSRSHGKAKLSWLHRPRPTTGTCHWQPW